LAFYLFSAPIFNRRTETPVVALHPLSHGDCLNCKQFHHSQAFFIFCVSLPAAPFVQPFPQWSVAPLLVGGWVFLIARTPLSPVGPPGLVDDFGLLPCSVLGRPINGSPCSLFFPFSCPLPRAFFSPSFFRPSC